jgi:hypothetical protein
MKAAGFARLYNNESVICPLCNERRARRSCPALGHQICTVCCGTKRLVEISCPSDCGYLSVARDHPAAAVVRRRQRDLGVLMQIIRELSDPQSQLLLLIGNFVVRFPAAELQPLVDADVAEAAATLAATYETSSRGVLYEHRAASIPAQRLATDLKSMLDEIGRNGGSAFERDAALVLRRLEDGVKHAQQADAGNRRALIDILARVVHAEEGDRAPRQEASRLILP